MSLALITRRAIFVMVVVIALFDIYVAAFGGPGATISLQLFGMSGGEWRGKTLTFAFGYIAGHIFGRIDG